MAVVVHIDKFSGPLALLLHLIRQEEMDIFDINIHEITKQYLDSIRAMRKLNLEVAGDFIAMAATLIQIKSRMLLPQYDEDGEVIESEDPRKDLVRRLLEYQAYQSAGQDLYKRNILGRDTWTRGMTEDFTQVEDEDIVLEEENALYALIRTYRQALRNVRKAVHKVTESLQSIAERIWEMRDKLIVGRTTRYSELIGGSGDRRGQLLITFLSLLELAKMGMVSLFQAENFADIHVETKQPIDRDSVSRVGDYDSKAMDVTPFAAAEVVLGDDDRAEENAGESTEQPDLFTHAAAAEPAFELEAATDEEIEAEELKYGLKDIEEPTA